jgi:hypothetical protein
VVHSFINLPDLFVGSPENYRDQDKSDKKDKVNRDILSGHLRGLGGAVICSKCKLLVQSFPNFGTDNKRTTTGQKPDRHSKSKKILE